MGIKKWSKTANSNDSISSSAGTINWKEGMPPSAVNDSARVTMADVRDWYEDAQWVNLGDADGTTSPRRATNEISLSGTHTLTYHVGRRLKALDGSGNLKYGRITATTFSGGTQITLAMDSGSLTSTVSQIWLSALTATNPAAGQAMVKGLTSTDTPTFAGISLGNETLSTYDEGSFTAALLCGTSGSASLSEATLKYIKIGNKVTITGRLTVSTISSPSGSLRITGLPFTVFNSSSNQGSGSIVPTAWAAGLTTAMALVAFPNTTTALVYVGAATGGMTTTNVANLLANSCDMAIELTYFTV